MCLPEADISRHVFHGLEPTSSDAQYISSMLNTQLGFFFYLIFKNALKYYKMRCRELSAPKGKSARHMDARGFYPGDPRLCMSRVLSVSHRLGLEVE